MSSREALVGRLVAKRYRVTSLIGSGGMGAVYQAEHIGVGKQVAIKFVDAEHAAEPTVATRFAREARAAGAIDNQHIVTVFDAGTDEGRPFIVMELLRGEDLGQRLRRLDRLPLEEVLELAEQTLRGLAAAHAAGIVHRDLKPDNLFLVDRSAEGEGPLLKIVDFGVSKIERLVTGTAPLALTGKGTLVGTPLYMSPEHAQAMPDADARADLYSVGAILFECLAGRPPHVGPTHEAIIISICMKEAPRLRSIAASRDVPEAVDVFVARALQRDRAQRFASAEEMTRALHELRLPSRGSSATRSMGARSLCGIRLPPRKTTEVAPRSVTTRRGRRTVWSSEEETQHRVSSIACFLGPSAVPPRRHPAGVWFRADLDSDPYAVHTPRARSEEPSSMVRLVLAGMLATMAGVLLTIWVARARVVPASAPAPAAQPGDAALEPDRLRP